MSQLNWIDGLVCFTDRAQLDSTVIAGAENIRANLRGAQQFPARAEIDPIALRSFLPYLSVVELQDQPFRVRYRLAELKWHAFPARISRVNGCMSPIGAKEAKHST